MFGSSAIYSSEDLLLNTISPHGGPLVYALPLHVPRCLLIFHQLLFSEFLKLSSLGGFSLDDFINVALAGFPNLSLGILQNITGAGEMVKYLPCVHEALFDVNM